VNQRKEFIILGWAGLGIILLILAFGWNGDGVQAQTVTVGFDCISPGASEVDKTTGEAQLLLDVTHHPGETEATFKFYNEAPVGFDPLPCSITDIYIQDGHLCTLLYIVDRDDAYPPPPPDNYGHPGVDFEIGATPGDLPDRQYATPPFVATKRFSMDSDPPVQPWGVNPNEWLVAVYSVPQGSTIYDIEQEIVDGVLRVGYHVQAFSDGKSASFVNNTEVIPEPTTVLLLGLGGLALLKKYKKYKNKC
jgi:hypothetical protein